MPTLKTETAAIIEVQATVRTGDANPTPSTIGLAIRYFSNGHDDDESYWNGSGWQKAATVVTSTQKDFHAHEYELPDTALESGMEGGRIVVRPADSGAIGPAVEYDVVIAKLDEATTAIIAEIDANEAKIDLLTPPAGLYEVTIHTQDSGAAPIPFVNVAIYDQSNTTQIWAGRTDSNGDWKVYLNAGTYKVRKSKNWYSFAEAETMVVTQDETFNFVGTAFTAPSPSHPNNCVIYGYAWNSGGEAVTNARVNMYAVTPQAVSDVQLTDYATHTTTDDDGYFKIEQVKNSEVWVEIIGAGPKVKKTVPNTDNQLFTTW